MVFWSERFLPTLGGISVAASRRLPALAERGVEFTVITEQLPGLGERDRLGDIPVHRLPLTQAIADRDLRRIALLHKQVRQLLGELQPDLVHVGFLGSSLLYLLAAHEALGFPLLVSLDSGIPDTPGSDSLFERALAAADWVTCVSDERLARVRALAPAITARSSRLANGRDAFSTPPAPLPGDGSLLCLGRLETVKGFDLALEAFARVRAVHPQARLRIAGEGPERQALARQVRALGLGGAVDLCGRVEPPAVPALFNHADMVLIPSRDEGLPGVALEAALMARPVIASRVGGLPDVVVPGETGLLVEPGDTGALATGIATLLSNPRQAGDLGQAARAHVTENFSWQASLDRTLAVYRRLTNPGSPRPAQTP